MGAEGVLSLQSDVVRLTRTLSDVTCPMAGVYVCTVSNGLSHPDQQLVKLDVLCELVCARVYVFRNSVFLQAVLLTMFISATERERESVGGRMAMH